MCEKCHKTYKTASNLKRHKCTYCEQCDHIFSTYQKYRNHSCQHQSHCDKVLPKCTPVDGRNIKKKEHEGDDNRKSATECVKIQTGFHVKSDTAEDSNSGDKENNKLETRKKWREYRIKSVKCDPKNTQKIAMTDITHIANREKSDVVLNSSVSCVPKPNQDASDEIQIVSTDPPAVRTFRPLNIESQKKLCDILAIETSHISEVYVGGPNESVLTSPAHTHSIIGDGNCLFRAVSFAVTGSEEHHLHIRHCACGHMKSLGRKMSSVIGGQTVVDYLRQTRMYQSATWGSQVELFTLAHLLKTDIYSYSKNGHVWSWSKYS